MKLFYDCKICHVDHECNSFFGNAGTYSREIIRIKPHLKKKKKMLAFSQTLFEALSFKLCVVITLLRVYIVMLGLMTLTLFQGHRCVRNINCIFLFV